MLSGSKSGTKLRTKGNRAKKERPRFYPHTSSAVDYTETVAHRGGMDRSRNEVINIMTRSYPWLCKQRIKLLSECLEIKKQYCNDMASYRVLTDQLIKECDFYRARAGLSGLLAALGPPVTKT